MILTAPITGSNFRPPEARDAMRDASNKSHLDLEAEPTNGFDKLAIKVNLGGHHIGYVAAHSRHGLHRHKDFHDHRDLWQTARLVRNDAGEARVQIGENS